MMQAFLCKCCIYEEAESPPWDCWCPILAREKASGNVGESGPSYISFFSCGFCVLYTILFCLTKSIIPAEIFKSDKKLIWTPYWEMGHTCFKYGHVSRQWKFLQKSATCHGKKNYGLYALPSCGQVRVQETCLHILFYNHADWMKALMQSVDLLDNWLVEVDTDLLQLVSIIGIIHNPCM